MSSSDNPFWFASDELSTDLLRVEIHAVAQLFAEHADLPTFFDLPEPTLEQRTACFAVLGHCALRDEIYERFAGQYSESPSLGDEEKDVNERTRSLFDSDAPGWVLETNEVAERLPSRVYDALPEALRRGGFRADDPAQREIIAAAANGLSSVEKIQALIEKVFRQQLLRIEERWAATGVGAPESAAPHGSKRKLKGFEGLGPKTIDLSRWMHGLTDKQEMAFSLKHEYGLGLAEIASRMNLNRKTAYEHIHAASKKIDEIRSGEKRQSNRPEE